MLILVDIHQFQSIVVKMTVRKDVIIHPGTTIALTLRNDYITRITDIHSHQSDAKSRHIARCSAGKISAVDAVGR